MKTAEEYAQLAENWVESSDDATLKFLLETRLAYAQVYATLAQAAAMQQDHKEEITVVCACGSVSYHPQSCPSFGLSDD